MACARRSSVKKLHAYKELRLVEAVEDCFSRLGFWQLLLLGYLTPLVLQPPDSVGAKMARWSAMVEDSADQRRTFTTNQ